MFIVQKSPPKECMVTMIKPKKILETKDIQGPPSSCKTPNFWSITKPRKLHNSHIFEKGCLEDDFLSFKHGVPFKGTNSAIFVGWCNINHPWQIFGGEKLETLDPINPGPAGWWYRSGSLVVDFLFVKTTDDMAIFLKLEVSEVEVVISMVT